MWVAAVARFSGDSGHYGAGEGASLNLQPLQLERETRRDFGSGQ